MLLPIITVEDLKSLLKSEELILVDASSGKMNNPNARFLKGAVYVDLETQMAELPSDAAQGGRHPLPDPAKFSQVIGELGISQNSRVVVYDDKFGSNAAARFWWMLKALGHERVHVLDGGEQAAVASGFELS